VSDLICERHSVRPRGPNFGIDNSTLILKGENTARLCAGNFFISVVLPWEKILWCVKNLKQALRLVPQQNNGRNVFTKENSMVYAAVL
jgi:hypothetical protein